MYCAAVQFCSSLIVSASLKSDEEQLISQTTSQYPHTEKHSETTQEEIAAPGKLPETPLRMDPHLLSGVLNSDEYDDRDQSQQTQIRNQNQMETPPKEADSSYSVSPDDTEPR